MNTQESSVFLPAAERNGTPKELFFIWFASNIGILGVVYGAMIVGFQLSFLQSLLAAAAGALSFALVGYLSLAGRDTGATTFVLSRAAFGFKGNYIPTFMGWLNLVGWLAVNVVTGTLTLLALFNVFGVSSNQFLTVMSLLIFTALIIVSSVFGQDALVKIQTFFTYVFGGLTLLVLLILIPKTNWPELMNMSNGDWLTGFLPAVSIIIAGTGISWSIAAADYSCYQKPTQSSRSVFTRVTFGAFIPLFVIMSVGVLMSTSVPDLAASANPIEVISQALPRWMTILYFVTALGGLIPQCIISLKSARVNLETLNIRVKDSTSVIIHAIIMILIPIYTLFVSENFMGNFQTFLGLLGIGMAAWAATFMIDYVKIRKAAGYDQRLLADPDYNQANYRGIISWLAGVIVGFMFTNSPFFDGPFARGIFQDNSLGVLLAFAVSALIYFILLSANSRK
ncbi:cytosine permease [Paenibacillus thiaminolyticus]|uniref:Allantoin permease n=1 Tax=Paenibacillus thiaminolyticus TaxID=49283 RepID=A0AAP9J322_PANTH|nr:cytosine permease [Paenibacillus thiaminolyticus]MCY9535865.1 cytosine permease [Paenibacillus thiaminolyticus]MCY9604998.1 cytosine permease [Paenibacillus thiaminolyticus]MCY9608576.1 cytosine permease [Paenibacillus thiaminolyticus]MCY9615617.1 cytosine permease [Paenibacillus thiaminolyticus]MCY9622224.1 cytosine permease [Paenibacillus thiaminolyticus]